MAQQTLLFLRLLTCWPRHAHPRCLIIQLHSWLAHVVQEVADVAAFTQLPGLAAGTVLAAALLPQVTVENDGGGRVRGRGDG